MHQQQAFPLCPISSHHINESDGSQIIGNMSLQTFANEPIALVKETPELECEKGHKHVESRAGKDSFSGNRPGAGQRCNQTQFHPAAFTGGKHSMVSTT